MIRAIIVCEGQTEEVFVNRVLGPPLAARDIFVEPRIIATSKHGKGGALKEQRVLRFLRNTLRERSDVYVTTFFDLYALPSDFPGLSEAIAHADPLERATTIEAGFHASVIQEAGCRQDRFLPHIQPYEFEALLFSDITQFANVQPAWKGFIGQLEAIRQSAPSPEHINDGNDTHPSARLRHLRPPYKKVSHGEAVSSRIGLERMRAECRHFDKWLTCVESLTPLRQAG